MSLKAALVDVTAALNAGGVDASIDAQNVNTPGVWVQLESIAHSILSGGVVVRARLYLVVGDAPATTALDNLDELLAAVLDIVSPNTDRDTESVSVMLPGDSTPLPALQLTVDLPTT